MEFKAEIPNKRLPQFNPFSMLEGRTCENALEESHASVTGQQVFKSIFFKQNVYFHLGCVSGWAVCMHLYHMCAGCSQRPEEDIEFLGTRLRDAMSCNVYRESNKYSEWAASALGHWAFPPSPKGIVLKNTCICTLINIACILHCFIQHEEKDVTVLP